MEFEDPFAPDPDLDSAEFTPWETGILSEHLLSGTIQQTGESAVFVANFLTYAATLGQAQTAAKVLFDWLIGENGIELVEGE